LGIDRDEFAWLFRAEYTEVVRTAYLLTQDRGTAEDIAQEAFSQLYSHWKKVSHYDRPDAWVRRVAIRLCGKHMRKRGRARAELERREEAEEQHASDVDLARAVRSLPGSQRAAIVLFYFEDRPITEVAEMLGCSTSTAKVHLHRARKKLAEALGEVYDDVSG
jgi:RNA polymerase sigma-70 factor (sigma-E family)